MTGTFVYSPVVEAHICTAAGKIYDVSADITTGKVTRVVNGVSSAQISLQNAGRKYDGVFDTMDRIVIYLTRVKRLLAFSGYLDSVPAFSALPGTVALTASCTLKRLQYWAWDPTTSAAYKLLWLGDVSNRADLTDGGLAKRILRVLTEVAGWPQAQVHIGAIPNDWFAVVAGVARDLIGEATKLQLITHVGSNGYVNGTNPYEKGTVTIQGIGAGTGSVPAPAGRLATYSARTCQLDASASKPGSSPWYVSMRWPYLGQRSRTSEQLVAIPGVSTSAARQWWMGRRMLVVNPTNNKAVCLSAVGWGPAERDVGPLPEADAITAARIAATSAQALKALGITASSGDVHVAFAPSGMKVGPQDTSTGSLVTSGGSTSGTSVAAGLGKALANQRTAVALADVASEWCRRHQGRDYLFGAEANASDPDPDRLDCCLTGDMLVHTARGPIPIAEIEPNDQVWAWEDGRLVSRQVAATKNQGVQEVLELRTRNRSVRATANHPFLRLTRGPRLRTERGVWLPVEWKAEWTRLDEICRGDVIVALDHLEDEPKTPRTLPDGVLLDEDLAWLLGVFVGDGHLNVPVGQFSICVYGELRDRVDAIVKRAWGLLGHHSQNQGTTYYSARVTRTLQALGLRVTSSERRVPEVVMGASQSVVDAFVRGYTDADGSYATRTDCEVVEYKASSPLLIQQVHALHIEMGHAVSPINLIKRTKPITIKGKLVKKALPLHCFEWYPRQSTKGNGPRLRDLGAYRALRDGRLRLENVRSVKPAGIEETYDIEVEGGHNFVAEGLIAHNSELVQWAHARSGAGNFVDGSANQYRACRPIPVSQARTTKGALVFVTDNGNPNSIHHVGISLGNGTTAEAQSTATGCGIFQFSGNHWTHAGLIPDLDYAGSGGSGAGGDPTGSGGTGDPGPSLGESLLNVFQWIGNADFGGDLLGGIRALMNDRPVMETIDSLVTAGLRQYCSAPNGDFIAWFPDYFGWWGTAGKLVVQPIEIQEGFSVAKSDTSLKTHWFVTSATTGVEGLGDATAIYQQYSTAGIASVEFAPLMKALFKVDDKQFANNGKGFLARYGARPQWEPMDNITGPRQEFFFAVSRFMLNWATQFTAPLPLTFMPELWPGMLVVLPTYGVQAYVQEVEHTFDLRSNAGFSTNAACIAWSTIGPRTGIPGLPKGSAL